MSSKALATWLSLLFVAAGPLAGPSLPTPAARPATAQPAGTDDERDLWSPANPSAGGLVFLVQPGDASIYVDGTYAGRPLLFSPSRPLKLGAGPHRVELMAAGYATTRIDVSVAPGFVTTVSAVMEHW